MKTKVIALTALLMLGAVVVGGIKTASKSHPIANLEEKKRQGRINFKERVQLAQAKGEERIVIPSLATLYMGVTTSPEALNQKLPDYTVVTAQLIEKKSYMSDEGVIRTWNKFEVVEALLQAPPRPAYYKQPSPPENLLPLKENEILVPSWGGTVTVDGVEVAQSDTDVPQFRKSQKYLLLLSLDPITKIGELELGPQALLPINPDSTLDAGKDTYLLQQAIKRHRNGSV